MNKAVFLFTILAVTNLGAQVQHPYESNPPSTSASTSITENPDTKVKNEYGVHDSANRAFQENMSGAKKAQLIGTGLTTTGSIMATSCCGSSNPGCCKTGIGMIIVGNLTQIQGKNLKNSGLGAGHTGGETDGYGNPFDSSGYNDGSKVDDNTTFSSLSQKVAEEFSKKNVPVKFDPKAEKFILPDGSKMGPSDMVSPSSMAAAGLSGTDIAAIQSTANSLEAKANKEVKTVVPSFGHESGGGGGAHSSASKSGEPQYDYAAHLPGHAEMSSLNTKAETAGLTKNYNGEPIGVANDSIFHMMTRRYQLKDRQDSFFTGNELRLQK